MTDWYWRGITWLDDLLTKFKNWARDWLEEWGDE